MLIVRSDVARVRSDPAGVSERPASLKIVAPNETTTSSEPPSLQMLSEQLVLQEDD